MPTRVVGDRTAQQGETAGSHARSALTSKQNLFPAARDCAKTMVRWLDASGTGMTAALPLLDV
jgi:hypothetical protein